MKLGSYCSRELSLLIAEDSKKQDKNILEKAKAGNDTQCIILF